MQLPIVLQLHGVFVCYFFLYIITRTCPICDMLATYIVGRSIVSYSWVHRLYLIGDMNVNIIFLIGNSIQKSNLWQIYFLIIAFLIETNNNRCRKIYLSRHLWISFSDSQTIKWHQLITLYTVSDWPDWWRLLKSYSPRKWCFLKNNNIWLTSLFIYSLK